MPDSTDSDLDYFTEGYCHELALELHRRTGWELWACVYPGDPRYDIKADGCHALVRLPGGWFLDVEGARDPQQVKDSWPGAVLRRVSARYFRAWSDEWGPVDPGRVNRAADRLLTEIGYKTLPAAA